MKPKYMFLSKTFPAYHPDAGKETGFVERIQSGNKKQTIRASNRYNVGDTIIFRQWSGRPYHSKQTQPLPGMVVKQKLPFEINDKGNYLLKGKVLSIHQLQVIALLDGFDHLDQFECWFKKGPFSGWLYGFSDFDYDLLLKS